MPERPETYPARCLIPFLVLRAMRRHVAARVDGAVHLALAEPTR
jgi:hypothetical protein